MLKKVKKQKPLGRGAGILLPVSCLPSDYGIGSLGKAAYDFVDFLAAAGQSYWQVLPLGPTGYGDSPYQSFSAFAGSPYYIDLQTLVEDGLLRQSEAKAPDWGERPDWVDYAKLYKNRFEVLKKAWSRSGWQKDPAFDSFCEENRFWLEDYALFMALKDSFDGLSWQSWPEEIRLREPAALQKCRERLKEQTAFWQYIQYLFFTQWQKLKTYANGKGVQIIGDIPIYVSMDSADVWANASLFQMDKSRRPLAVAGVPPDLFSATGQLWGNPLYRWDYHRDTGYDWWMKRLAACFELYDVVRIDHFRGFDEYFAIPYGDATAERGGWRPGPGYDFMRAIKKNLGDKSIIAEDLGFLTPTVLKLVKESGYPGMKVMQFAFDSREKGDYLPHNYPYNCVAYTGTHDNDTMVGWLEHVDKEDLAFAKKYLNICTAENLHWIFIRHTLASVADTAIIPIQDYLGLGSEARINTPSVLGGNWQWRLLPGQLDKALAEQMLEAAHTYGRA